MELIDRIRVGVKKDDWKQLIMSIGSTEREFEYVLPSSISSMQKKSVYGLGYDVFDSKDDFRNG